MTAEHVAQLYAFRDMGDHVYTYLLLGANENIYHLLQLVHGNEEYYYGNEALIYNH